YAGEAGEGTFADTHRLVLLELDLELRLFLAVGDAVDNLVDLVFRKRSGLLTSADKSGDARGAFHHVPDVIVHVHFDQDIAGIEHALAGVLLPTANLGDRLGGD